MGVLVELHRRSPFPPVSRLWDLDEMMGQLTWDLTCRFLEVSEGWCGPFLTVLALDSRIVSWKWALLRDLAFSIIVTPRNFLGACTVLLGVALFLAIVTCSAITLQLGSHTRSVGLYSPSWSGNFNGEA